MTSFSVEMPDPVIEAFADYNPEGYGHRKEWKARVVVGGIEILENYYTSEYTFGVVPQPDDFAETAEEAAAKIAAEFGQKLKELMSL